MPKPNWAKPKAPKAVKELVEKKDSNGGKLGQFTTEVAKTIQKAKEEQRKDSAAFFLKEIEKLETFYALKIKWIKEEKSNFKGWAVFLVGVVIGAALFAIASV